VPLRPRRAPILRTVARTAVISGTATVVSGNVARRQAARHGEAAPSQPDWAAQQEWAAQQAPPPAAVAPAPAAAGSDDLVAQLRQLGELRDQGILTEEEFAAQKAKLLGS